MEFVDGVSLQDRLRRQVPFSLPEIVRIGAQVAAGLAAAHARGLVHRDIKPANILLARPADQVKIADFGLARASDDAGVTLPGAIMGTPAYMAPEQALGQAVDHRADLFSFGSVLYALCTGQPPYSGSTTLAVIRQVADGSPPSLAANTPSLPPWLVAVVSKLHAVNPADRFQSAAEVAQLFRQQWKALQGTGPAAGSELPPERESLPAGKGTAAVSTRPRQDGPTGSAEAASCGQGSGFGVDAAAGAEPRSDSAAGAAIANLPPALLPVPRPPAQGGRRRYRIIAALGVLLLLSSIAALRHRQF